jgi:flagellar FliJ protein
LPATKPPAGNILFWSDICYLSSDTEILTLLNEGCENRMTKFTFPLEQVLRYRQQLEEQAMLRLSRAQSARNARRREADAYAVSLLTQQVKLSEPADLTEQERWVIGRYITALQQDLKTARNDLARLEEELDRCREELMLKARDRKLLDRLKDHQAARHMRKQAQQEQRDYDEIATLRFAVPTV